MQSKLQFSASRPTELGFAWAWGCRSTWSSALIFRRQMSRVKVCATRRWMAQATRRPKRDSLRRCPRERHLQRMTRFKVSTEYLDSSVYLRTRLRAWQCVAEHVFEDDGRRLRVAVDRATVEREGGKSEEVLRLSHHPLLVHVTVVAINRNRKHISTMNYIQTESRFRSGLH